LILYNEIQINIQSVGFVVLTSRDSLLDNG